MTDALQSNMGWYDHAQAISAAGHALHSLRPSRQVSSVPGLNLFRRNDERDIICAVSEDSPVPSFLQDPAWSFAGRLDWTTSTVPGFDVRAARSACNGLGFYLFQTWGGVEPGSAIEVRDRN